MTRTLSESKKGTGTIKSPALFIPKDALTADHDDLRSTSKIIVADSDIVLLGVQLVLPGNREDRIFALGGTKLLVMFSGEVGWVDETRISIDEGGSNGA